MGKSKPKRAWKKAPSDAEPSRRATSSSTETFDIEANVRATSSTDPQNPGNFEANIAKVADLPGTDLAQIIEAMHPVLTRSQLSMMTHEQLLSGLVLGTTLRPDDELPTGP